MAFFISDATKALIEDGAESHPSQASQLEQKIVEKMLKTIRHRKSGSQRHDIGPKHEIQIFLEDS
jgi:plasmid stabilization system protein ParE